ncbi:MAG: PaREP1 family protein [Desulfurococcales archaeon]|nr:PaREP1 family protein [Desulfurococcales archaeon]
MSCRASEPGLGPRGRPWEYVGAAEDLLEEAGEGLGKCDARRAAEKLWGSGGQGKEAPASRRSRRRPW